MQDLLHSQHVVFSSIHILKMLKIIENDKCSQCIRLHGRHNRVYIKMVRINKKVEFRTLYLAFKLFLVYSNRAFAFHFCTLFLVF